MHAARLARVGVGAIAATYRTLNRALTQLTRGPIPD